jgi:hypothetical protein
MRGVVSSVSSAAVLIVLAVMPVGSARLAAQVQPGMATNQGVSSTEATGVIVGRVIDAVTGRPISGATVSLSGAGTAPGTNPLAVVLSGGTRPPTPSVTNGDGYFLFRDVPASSYTVGATATGYITSAYGSRRPDSGGLRRTIVLHDDEHVIDVVVKMWHVATIGGRVVDDTGEPVVGTTVRVMRRDRGGRLSQAAIVQTDDRGIYRAASLTPSDYVVMVASTFLSMPTELVNTLRGNPSSPVLADLRRDAAAAFFFPEAPAIDTGDMQILMSSQIGGLPMPTPGADGHLRAYPTTFAPSASTVARAETIRLTAGQERSDVDVHLTLTPMFRVSGVVTGPDGPMSALGLRLLPADAPQFQSDLNIDVATTATGSDGRFTFLGVPPGQYEIRATRTPRPTAVARPEVQTIIATSGRVTGIVSVRGDMPQPAPDGPTWWARQPVSVGNRDVSSVSIGLRTGARVSGLVQFDGVAPAQNDLSRLGVLLRPADGRTTSLPSPVPIDDRLSFVTPQVPADRYVVAVTGMPAGWNLASIRASTGDITDHPFTLDTDLDGVVVTLTRLTTTIAGSVTGAHPGDPDAVVALFPADVRAWIDDGMLGSRVQTIDVRPDGSYQSQNLTAGEYAVAAVPAETTIDVHDAALFTALARVATRVSVGTGQTRTQSLTVSAIQEAGRP